MFDCFKYTTSMLDRIMNTDQHRAHDKHLSIFKRHVHICSSLAPSSVLPTANPPPPDHKPEGERLFYCSQGGESYTAVRLMTQC